MGTAVAVVVVAAGSLVVPGAVVTTRVVVVEGSVAAGRSPSEPLVGGTGLSEPLQPAATITSAHAQTATLAGIAGPPSSAGLTAEFHMTGWVATGEIL